MTDFNDDQLEPTSESFQSLCAILDLCILQTNATCSADVFSGGFKFSDEAPADFEKLGDRLVPFVDLMRCLWGYRASIVMGKPRPDLVRFWEGAKSLAPRWAGFTAERSSDVMKIHVDEVERRTMDFIQEMDRFDRSLAKSRASV